MFLSDGCFVLDTLGHCFSGNRLATSIGPHIVNELGPVTTIEDSEPHFPPAASQAPGSGGKDEGRNWGECSLKRETCTLKTAESTFLKTVLLGEQAVVFFRKHVWLS